jgi:nucleotide-binding universal stress UspA family protein
MFGVIVVALDGSEAAQRALPIAAELARRDGARLVIAHVDEAIAAKGGAHLRADEPDICAALERQAAELSARGIDTSLEVVEIRLGGPARAIAEIAAEADADLIVVATRGHTPLSGLLVGSVTQRLLHIAHRPVLVVPVSW